MFNAYFKTPKGIDATRELVFVAAMAGHACHRAVIAQHGKNTEVTTKEGKKFFSETILTITFWRINLAWYRFVWL